MTLYALRPDPATGSLEDSEVVSEYRYGWQFLEQAVILWRLLDDARAGLAASPAIVEAELAEDTVNDFRVTECAFRCAGYAL